MSGDRSLDEFFGSESEGERDADGNEEDRDPESETESRDVEDADSEPEPAGEREPDVESLTTIYTWSPDGECTVCGTAAKARWRDDGEFVCADCKDW